MDEDRQWRDALALLPILSRSSRASKIEHLQEMRSRARKEDLGECFAEVRRYQLEEMDATLDTLLGILAASSPSEERLAVISEASRRKRAALLAIRKEVEPDVVAQEEAEEAAKERVAQAKREAEAREAARLAEVERQRVAAQEAAAERVRQQTAEAARLMEEAREAQVTELRRQEGERIARSNQARAAFIANWQARYVGPMGPTKAALRVLLEKPGEGSRCEEFRQELGKVDYLKAFAGAEVGTLLTARNVLDALRRLGATCGQDGASRLDYTLGSLSRDLRRYGLTP